MAADVELHGEVVPAGAAIVILMGAANRDERKYLDPNRFDIKRDIGMQLTFGHGAHFCLGAALARLEGRIALDELLNRFPEWDVDVDGGGDGDELDRARLGVPSPFVMSPVFLRSHSWKR